MAASELTKLTSIFNNSMSTSHTHTHTHTHTRVRGVLVLFERTGRNAGREGLWARIDLGAFMCSQQQLSKDWKAVRSAGVCVFSLSWKAHSMCGTLLRFLSRFYPHSLFSHLDDFFVSRVMMMVVVVVVEAHSVGFGGNNTVMARCGWVTRWSFARSWDLTRGGFSAVREVMDYFEIELMSLVDFE